MVTRQTGGCTYKRWNYVVRTEKESAIFSFSGAAKAFPAPTPSSPFFPPPCPKAWTGRSLLGLVSSAAIL